MKEKYEKELNRIVDDYYKFSHFDRAPVKYIITEDMIGEYRKNNPGHPVNEDELAELPNVGGTTISPHFAGETFVVLINLNQWKQYEGTANEPHLATIVHETTHVHDFITLAELLEKKDLIEFLNSPDGLQVKQWSEFHAHSQGRYYMLTRVQHDNSLFFYLDNINMHYNYFTQALLESKENTENTIMRFCGRIRAEERAMGKKANSGMLVTFKKIPGLFELYRFLCTHEKPETINGHYDELEQLIAAVKLPD